MDENKTEEEEQAEHTTAPATIIAPPCCPFSGVAIDPKLWETFKAKMKAQNEADSDDDEDDDPIIGDLLKIAHRHGIHNPLASPSSNDEVPPIPDLSIETITNEQGMAMNSLIKNKNCLRMKLVNSSTNRSKDLMVDISEDLNLWDGIYNLPQVKEAHVRKWNSDVASRVKSGSAKIQLHIWDEAVQQPWHIYELSKLKKTTTKELYEQVVPDSNDVLVLKLVCVDCDSIDNSIS
jgi:hypothetical protein